MKMKITVNDVMVEIGRIKMSGYEIVPLNEKVIKKIVKQANENSYYIENEGLYGFVWNRVVKD